MLTIHGIADLRRRVGTKLGVSDWRTIPEEQVSAFAAVTGDDNWIHFDQERAARTPLGTTIVHGHLTLALEPVLGNEVYDIVDIDYDLDYGYSRIRFPVPVPVGARVRMHATLTELADVDDGVRCTVRNVIELEGSAKPALVTELILHVVGPE